MMKNRYQWPIAFWNHLCPIGLSVLLLLPGITEAKEETYTLTSGKVLSGKVLEQDEERIRLETKEGVVVVPRRMLSAPGKNISAAGTGSQPQGEDFSASDHIMEMMLFLNAGDARNGAASFKADPGKKTLQYFDKDGRLFEEAYIDENNAIVTKTYNKQGEVSSESTITEESMRQGRPFGHRDPGERQQERVEIEKQDDDAAALRIVEETKKAYAEMQSFTADVKVTSDLVIDAMPYKKITNGREKLLKPDFYNVGWGVDSSSEYPEAAWNGGKGDFIFYFGKYYRKEKTSLVNFAGASGISSKITYTIPTLFFPKDETVFSHLQNFRMRNPEVIDNETCHVIEAVGNLTPKIIFWISQERKIILQVEEHRDTRFGQDPYADPASLSDDNIKERLTAEGEDPTPENIRKRRESISRTAKEMAQMEVTGTITEIFKNIRINPGLDPASLDFPVPAGAVLEK